MTIPFRPAAQPGSRDDCLDPEYRSPCAEVQGCQYEAGEAGYVDYRYKRYRPQTMEPAHQGIHADTPVLMVGVGIRQAEAPKGHRVRA